MVSKSGKPFSVSEISTLIRTKLEESFGMVEIEGEVTDYRGANAAGHHYFSLKDDSARISLVLFSGRARALNLRLENGKKVRCTGKLTTFAGTSRYQIIVSGLTLVGIGDLAKEFEELKQRLLVEGLFAKEHKRPLPILPRYIGIVTSPTGSVIRDFLNISTRRFPNLDILLAPAKVQGDGAAEEIAAAIRDLNKVGVPGSGFLEEEHLREVIIVMRGGGSMEELWCFNEEIVARAVYESSVPVISGVGHETDFTICDFAADLRAPTPSAAAELLVRPKDDFRQDFQRVSERLLAVSSEKLYGYKTRLAALTKNRVFAEPEYVIDNYRQRLDGLMQRISAALNNRINLAQRRFLSLKGALEQKQSTWTPQMRSRLDALSMRLNHSMDVTLQGGKSKVSMLERQLRVVSPESVLKRGYSITTLEDGTILRLSNEAPVGTHLSTRLSDGNVVKSIVGVDVVALPSSKKKRTPKAQKEPPGESLLFDTEIF